jgi:hypothetical protein
VPDTALLLTTSATRFSRLPTPQRYPHTGCMSKRSLHRLTSEVGPSTVELVARRVEA